MRAEVSEESESGIFAQGNVLNMVQSSFITARHVLRRAESLIDHTACEVQKRFMIRLHSWVWGNEGAYFLTSSTVFFIRESRTYEPLST